MYLIIKIIIITSFSKISVVHYSFHSVGTEHTVGKFIQSKSTVLSAG